MMRWFIFVYACVLTATLAIAQEPLEQALTLKEALKKAYALNPQVVMSNARLEAALARIEEQRAMLLPHVSGTLNGGRQTYDLRANGMSFPGAGPHIGPFNSVDAKGNVSLSIFDPGAFARLHAAAKGGELSRAELAKTRQDILALVATLYVQVLRSKQTLHVVKTTLNANKKVYAIAQNQYKQGTGSLLEVNRALSDLTQSRYAYLKAKTQVLEDRLNLNTALGFPAEMRIHLKPDPAIIDELNLLSQAENKSADIVLAQAQLNAQSSQKKVALANFLPTLTALGNYGRTGADWDQSSNTYRVGIVANIPIWEGGLHQAQLKEAKALVKESESNLEDVRRRNAANIILARENLNEAKALFKASTAQAEFAVQSLKIAKERLKSGTGSDVDVALAEASAAQANDQRLESQAIMLMSQLRLAQNLGQLQQLIQDR